MPNIPNTIITNKGNCYGIRPVANYVLHHKARDFEEPNFETGEWTSYRGYGTSEATEPLDYDFDNTTTIDGYTAYGIDELFARPRSEVPENQIFGGGNDHEVM